MSEEQTKPMEKVYNDATGEYELVKYEYQLMPVKVNEDKEWENFASLVNKRNELQYELEEIINELDLYQNIFNEEDLEDSEDEE